MKTRSAILPAAAALCAALVAVDAAGQQPFGPSVEASVGVSAGGGGLYEDRGGVAADAVAALPVGRAAGGTFVLAAAAGATAGMGGDLVCTIGPDGECLRGYPAVLSLAVLAGVQRALTPELSLRALAGPAYFRVVEGGDAVGVQGRVDVAMPVVFRTALVASLRGSLIPRYRGEALHSGALGLGVRIQ